MRGSVGVNQGMSDSSVARGRVVTPYDTVRGIAVSVWVSGQMVKRSQHLVCGVCLCWLCQAAAPHRALWQSGDVESSYDTEVGRATPQRKPEVLVARCVSVDNLARCKDNFVVDDIVGDRPDARKEKRDSSTQYHASYACLAAFRAGNNHSGIL